MPRKPKKPDPTKVPIVPFPIGESQEHFDRLQKELMEQTDRGAALIGGAFLEWRIKQAIRTRLHTWDEHGEVLFGNDEKPGELMFANQCRMAYCLGLVGKEGLRDLGIVGRIRNKFAHRLSVTSFEVEHVARQCKDLGTPEIWHEHWRLDATKPPSEPRLRYVFTVQLLHSMVWAVAVSGVLKWPRRRKGVFSW